MTDKKTPPADPNSIKHGRANTLWRTWRPSITQSPRRRESPASGTLRGTKKGRQIRKPAGVGGPSQNYRYDRLAVEKRFPRLLGPATVVTVQIHARWASADWFEFRPGIAAHCPFCHNTTSGPALQNHTIMWARRIGSQLQSLAKSESVSTGPSRTRSLGARSFGLSPRSASDKLECDCAGAPLVLLILGSAYGLSTMQEVSNRSRSHLRLCSPLFQAKSLMQLAMAANNLLGRGWCDLDPLFPLSLIPGQVCDQEAQPGHGGRGRSV